MRGYYTVDEILSPGFPARRAAEEKAAADKYDADTGTNQLMRDSTQLQLFVRRREMFCAALVEALTPNDRAAYADEVSRLDDIIEREQERLGL